MGGALELEPVRSSNIAAIGYDAEQQVLQVEFANGGVYRYMDVPQGVVDDLLSAPSIGRFFGRNVRNKYTTGKVR